MSASRRWSMPRILALAWLAVVLAVAAHQWCFWRAPSLDTDVFALLPQDGQLPAAQMAMRQMAEHGERRIVVAIGAPDWDAAKAAAASFTAVLDNNQAGLHAIPLPNGMEQAVAFYRPWRNALLTDAQRTALAQGDGAAMASRALSRLQDVAAVQPTSWLEDPVGLWPEWWSERAQLTSARPRDGRLWIHDGQRDWLVLLYETEGSAFRMDGDRRWSDALELASQAARATVSDSASIRVLSAGVPLHAEAAAAQGNWEMNTIGWGSLVAVVLLVWWTFRAVRPVVLIAISLLVGCAAALSVTLLVFGRVHVLTLVFGASLVGVAEDFGIHYFASRLASPRTGRWALMRHLLPGLFLAMLTSVLGYLVLAVVPFPGLRQMALFSAVGMAAAMLTAVCWFPLLDRGALPGSPLAKWIASSLERWPRLGRRKLAILLSVFALLCAGGLYRLKVSDDLRQLQSSPPELIQAQIELGRLLQMPSPAQFFLLQQPSAEALLQSEEQLKAKLAPMLAQSRADGVPLGLSAISDWVPSQARQAENRAITAKTETQVLQRAGNELGENLERPAFAAQALVPAQWLASPVSEGMRVQWLGQSGDQYASVVLVRGLGNRAQGDALKGMGEQIPGVRWVDRAADISALLGRFGGVIGWLLVLGHVAVLAALVLRYGKQAWRAWLPTVLASAACVAVQGWLGEPFQLFNLLALMLLLGVGVDYGIFLLEHQGDEQGHAWLAVLIGAISTGLSFGLLALSATPALHSYGLTLLVGLVLVCLLAPNFRLQKRGDL